MKYVQIKPLPGIPQNQILYKALKKCIFCVVGMLGKGTKTEGVVVLSENWYRDEYVNKICANETCA